MIEQIKYNQIYASNSWYDFEKMKCVDPDSLRFAQKESDGVWQFCQITNILINSIFEGNPEGLIAAYKHNKIVNGVDVFVELNKSYSMISSTVNLVDEDKSTLEEYKRNSEVHQKKTWNIYVVSIFF